MSCPVLGKTVADEIRVEGGDRVIVEADFNASGTPKLTVRPHP
jgi:hypothetical protein